MKSINMLISLFSVFLLTSVESFAAVGENLVEPKFGQSGEVHQMLEIKPAECPEELRAGMRVLWEDHALWTRMFIVSFVHSLPNLEVTTQRLLRNQVDIGKAIEPYYGSEAGTALTQLLTSHILIAADLLTAVKNGDADGITEKNRLWMENADQIAIFLNSANPTNWPLDEMKAMMYEHLRLTTNEAVAEFTGDYAGSVRAYDEVRNQILNMSDMLANGIAAQFPCSGH